MVLISSLGQDVTLLWFGSADYYERDEPSGCVALEHYVVQIPAIFMALDGNRNLGHHCRPDCKWAMLLLTVNLNT